MKKRFLSSPWSFAQTLRHYADSDGGSGIEEDDEDQYYQEVLGSGQSDEEEGAAAHPEFTALRHSKRSDPLVAATQQDIDSLIEWGLGYENKPDARLQALIEFLDAVCRPDGRTWTQRAGRGVHRVRRDPGLDRPRPRPARVPGRQGTRGHPGLDPRRGAGGHPREVHRAAGQAAGPRPRRHRLGRRGHRPAGATATGWSTSTSRSTRPGWSSGSAASTATASSTRRRSTSSPPAGAGIRATRRTRSSCWTRCARRSASVAADLGSVNEVIDADIQDHFTPGGTGRKVKLAARDDGSVIINRVLAGGQELNRTLTELSRTYGDRKAEMHLTPANARRVVDTALELTSQPPLRPVEGDDPVEVFEVPALGSAWQFALRGLETRLNPGVLRPVTFDEEVAEGRDDIVYIHLGHALLQRSARILREALFNVDSPVHRVTAVVAEGLPQSCVAAVSRLVLVGLGGLRLHEEVFLTGIRLRGSAMAEAKVEEVLDQALDAQDLVLAGEDVRRRLADQWNADGAPLRTRLLTAMEQKARSHQERVIDTLYKRRDTDIARAREIFAAFRVNLQESRDRLDREIRSEEEKLFPDDQQRQRRHDLASMIDRLNSLDDEERREIDAISARYAEIKPHVTAAAVVFALTPEDAAGSEEPGMRRRQRPAPRLARPARHRRPVPVRPRPEEGVAHGHAAPRPRRARRAPRRQARVREGLGRVGHGREGRLPTRRRRAGEVPAGARRLGGRHAAHGPRLEELLPHPGIRRREGPLARLLGHRQPDRRAHPRRHDRGARPRHRPGRIAARPARRRLGRQPHRPDGGTAPGLRGPRRRRHRRALVGDRQRPPRDDGRLRHHRLPAVDRAARRPRRVHQPAAPAPPGRQPDRGPAHRALRRLGRRRRGDHRGPRHQRPPRRGTARPGTVGVRARRPAPRRARPAARQTATRCTRPPSR